MEKTTITVFIPKSDFSFFLEIFKIVCDLPNLEANYTFRGKDIRMYTEKMMGENHYQINIPIMDYIKWTCYHKKNSI